MSECTLSEGGAGRCSGSGGGEQGGCGYAGNDVFEAWAADRVEKNRLWVSVEELRQSGPEGEIDTSEQECRCAYSSLFHEFEPLSSLR
jgi:hypothetical protein